MWKYIYKSDKDIQSELNFLRKKFNTEHKEYYFKAGKHKGDNVIFVLNDLTTKVYGEPIISKQHKDCMFYPPTDDTKIDLEQYEIHKNRREYKIKVDLVDGHSLYIIPASLEPKRVVFDLDEVEEEDNPYSTATEYGRLAYSLYDEAKKGDSLPIAMLKKLVILSLMKSYNIPIDIWNWLGIVSAQDFDPIAAAAMGISPELTKKKVDG